MVMDKAHKNCEKHENWLYHQTQIICESSCFTWGGGNLVYYKLVLFPGPVLLQRPT
jgi:hypothetical protein